MAKLILLSFCAMRLYDWRARKTLELGEGEGEGEGEGTIGKNATRWEGMCTTHHIDLTSQPFTQLMQSISHGFKPLHCGPHLFLESDAVPPRQRAKSQVRPPRLHGLEHPEAEVAKAQRKCVDGVAVAQLQVRRVQLPQHIVGVGQVTPPLDAELVGAPHGMRHVVGRLDLDYVAPEEAVPASPAGEAVLKHDGEKGERMGA